MGFLAAVAVAPALGRSPSERTVALLFDSLVSPFWVAAIERFRARCAARGWPVLEAVSNLDDNKQYQQVQSMLQRRVDGIVIVQTDAKAVIPAIRSANASHVPIVHFNRPPSPSDAYSVAVVADNRKLMQETTSALLEIARRQGGRYKAAVLIGDLGDVNAVNRRDGMQDVLDHNRDLVEVVARIATEWNADKAFSGLSNSLQAHPDINMLITSSDFLTPQIQQALRAAGKWHKTGEPGHVLIAGFDGDANAYRELAAAYFDVDGVQDLDFEVDLSLEALERMWAGGQPPRILVDPGFVIGRETLMAKRERMWGYGVWRADTGVTISRTARSGTLAPGSSSVSASRTGSMSTAAGVRSAKWLLFTMALLGFAQAMFSTDTLRQVLLAMLPLAILAGGQLLVLLIGQIDLSMTAVMALGSVVSASVMTGPAARFGQPMAMLLGVLACLAVGAIVGLFNGICYAVLSVPSFIVTLAVMMAGGGVAVWYASTVSDTISIGGLPGTFKLIGYGTAGGIPIAFMLCAGALIAIQYVLSHTVAGRWLYAIGHNAQASRIAGVPVRLTTIAAFTASGLCAALAAIIYTARMETGLPTLGSNMLLDIVGAAVIGGVSLFGGRGNVRMILVGVAFLSVLDKSLQLLGLSLFVVLAVKGCTILATAILDVTRTGRRVRDAG